MPNSYYTVRTLHGTNTDIPFSSDRTVTTNIIHEKNANILEMSMHHYPASASRQTVEHKGLKMTDFEGLAVRPFKIFCLM